MKCDSQCPGVSKGFAKGVIITMLLAILTFWIPLFSIIFVA